MRLTIQLKLLPTPEQVGALRHTLETANAACDYISQVAWDNHTFRRGGIELGETEEACVEREMREETCLQVRVQQLLLDEPGIPGGVYQRLKTSACHVVEGDARPGYAPEPDAAATYSITDIGWFDLRNPASWHELVVSNSFTYPLLQRIQAALGYPIAQAHALA